ncbi:MAG: uncharacterized protein QOJ88_1010 [Pyrinomonadaceae bacterium]|jgi:phage tail sheath protein FI|nr:uncharacterized protein [Pyrinomonadaceae bacterium]
MPEYLSPGVYVEEIDAGPKPIEGVSTSTCGALGITARGPTSGKPELVTSFAEFQRKFGGFLPEPLPALANGWALNEAEGGRWWQFPLSVKGFFDNGGQRLYVKRVFSSTATTAAVELGHGLASEILRDAPAAATELRLRHTIGIENGTAIQLIVNGQAAGNFTVQSYSAAGAVVLDNPVGQDIKGGRDFVQIIARTATAAGPPDERLTVRAKASGSWGGDENSETGILAGNGLRVRVRPEVAASLKLLASPVAGGSPASTAVLVQGPVGATVIEVRGVEGLTNGDTVSVDGAEYVVSAVTAARFDIAPSGAPPPAGPLPAGTEVRESGQLRARLAAPATTTDAFVIVDTVTGLTNGDTVVIGANSYVIANVTTARLTVTPAVPSGDPWEPGTVIRRLRPAYDTGTPGLIVSVQNAAQLYPGALVELDNGTDKEQRVVDSINGESVTLSGPNLANNYFEGHRLRLIEVEIGARYLHNYLVAAEEILSNLRLVDDGGPNYIVRRVNEESKLFDLEAGADFAGAVDTFAELPSLPLPSAAAPNGPQMSAWWNLTGGADNLEGLTVDDFVGVQDGGERSTGVQSLEYIDEISICMAPGMWSSTIQSALIIHCETLKDRFAILDPPGNLDIEDVRVFREPLDTKYAALYYPHIEVRDPSLKRNVAVGPSGHMAGIYARVDVERGVHKAPANEVIRGITRIADDVTKREQDLLNPRNINVLRFFPGRGNRVWGARVVTSDAAWKYINVRRLFIFVEESIDEGTQWVVFEPNDEPLWARVRATINNFLTSVWRTGALQGAKPDEAFFVRCDRTTMTQDDIDNGRLICLVGIAPVKPAEFVIFRIQQKTLENKVS